MQDHETTPDTTPEAAPKRGRRRLFALIGGSALAIGGLFGANAFAQSKAYQHVRLATFGEGGWHHGRKPLHEMTDADLEAHVTRMVRHLSIEIDATPDQERKLIDIAVGAASELRSVRGQMRATADELQRLLTADTVDRAALESLRMSRLAEADRISKTLADAVADAAEVLTPAQRETVQKMIAERRERGRRRHERG